MKCPDCRRALADVATACRCGWIAQPTGERALKVRCADCEADAIMRVNGANLCEKCDSQRVLNGALKSLPDDLMRQPDEPLEHWQKRAVRWLRESVNKRFASQGGQHETRP